MPFGVAKNGMRMYIASWQLEPGARMKQMNRASSDAYFKNFSTLGSNLLTAVTDQSTSMMEITSKVVQKRLQDSFNKKLAQAKAGLDVTI
jgi:hypothetical protein